MTTQMIQQGAARLTEWGVLRASGEEAAKFLHGQLTQDIVLMSAGQARLAGFCSAKGRLLASFIAWKPSPDEVLMAMPAEVLPAVLKRLSMFVLRAKCKLSDASAQFALWGVVGDGAPAEIWQRSGDSIRLPDAAGQRRYLLVQAAEAPAPALPEISEAQWQWLDVQSGLAWVRGATVEQFVPQMINLELLGGVNFQKGCYPGQEIVARSQYRGTIKRRTFLFDSEAPAAIGQEIFHSADAEQPAGLVAGVAPNPAGGYSLLAEVKMATLAAGSLHLGSVSGAELKARPLPYDIDVDVTE
ncbi:MAG: folate-binding protein YgfZ [Burkholderiaceae bacterium]|nr:folate-binding protein YgfZ [Burkholderiaceae bacterium]